MTVHDSVLASSEKIILALRELYLNSGYRPYRMSKFEEYDLYARNKEFLVSDNVITFTDTNGKLMALKPDVTLSIIKNTKDLPDVTQKVFYNENVYRVSKGTGEFKEIMQTGVECFGKVDEDAVCEVLRLAAQSLRLLSPNAVLVLSDLDIVNGIVAELGLPKEDEAHLWQAIGEKNPHEIERACAARDGERVALLKELVALQGKASEVLPTLERLLGDRESCRRFGAVCRKLAASDVGDAIRVDLSVTADSNYYSGIVFKGFIRDVPTAVLSGGQYDRLMQKMQRRSCAIGFAVYTDELERLDAADAAAADGFINVALPKGRLGGKVYDKLAAAGFECPSILEPNRKLIFENPEKRVRYFWVKPSDVAIYVEHGAADVGIVGKDILMEYEPDVYELYDLDIGKCRMAVAAPKGFADDPARTLRVATKFSNIARSFYRGQGRDIDIIHLNGSIEIAPILGLSDVIVDIVETGTTLKENDLEVIDEVAPISARFIANKASYKFKGATIDEMIAGLAAPTEEIL